MAVASCWMVSALMAVVPLDVPGGTHVAIVNVGAVSEQYLKTSELEAKFERRRRAFNEHRDALRDRIDRTGRSMDEEFKPGTKEYDERRKQLTLLQAELQWYIDSEGGRIERGLASSLRTIYDDIQDAVRELAREKGIDVVLAADELPEDPPSSAKQARQQILLQKVIYWHPEVDLTDEVVARLNAGFTKAKRQQDEKPKP